MTSPLRRAAGAMRSSFNEGSGQASASLGSTSTMGSSGAAVETASSANAPAWARRMKRSQTMSHGLGAATHAIRSGDAHGGGSSVNLSEGDR